MPPRATLAGCSKLKLSGWNRSIPCLYQLRLPSRKIPQHARRSLSAKWQAKRIFTWHSPEDPLKATPLAQAPSGAHENSPAGTAGLVKTSVESPARDG